MRGRRVRMIAAAVVVVVGAGLVLLRVVDVDRFRGSVEAALSARLHRDVSLGRLHVSFAPPGLRVEKAAIADDPRFQRDRPFAQADDLYLTVRLIPLLRGRFEPRTLTLRRPIIELVRNAEGTWNFATLGGEEPEPGGSTPVLDRLLITNGEVAVTDNGRAVYRNIDVRLDEYAPDRAFEMVLAATLPGTGAQRLNLRGTVGPVVRDSVATTPFDGMAQFDAVSLSGLRSFLQLAALEGTDTVISGTAELGSREGRLSSQGSVRLEHTRVRGVDIGYPITADFDVAHDARAGRLTVTSGTVRLDRTPMSLTGTVDLQRDTPGLDVHVTASDASLAEAARLASAFGVAFGTDTRVQGRLNADVHARGPADRPALTGQLQLRDVTISGADIPRPVRTPAVDLALTPEAIRSNDFSARTNDTTLGVRVALSQYTTATPAIDASVRTTDADLGEVLSVARAWGVGAVDGLSGTGRLTLNVRASGPTGSPSYSGSGSLSDASLKTPSIAQPLKVRTASLTFSSDAAAVNGLAVTMGTTSAEGSVTVRNFAAPHVEFQLSADSIDVRELQEWLAPARTPYVRPGQRQAGTSMLLQTVGSGVLRAGSVTYGQLVLEDVAATATLDRGVIRLEPLAAALFGGRHRGAVVMDARQTPATVTVASNLEQVDVNRLLSAATSLRGVIAGALMSVVRVNFSTDGAGSIAPSLNGTLSLDVPDGRLATMDLMHEMAAIGRFAAGEEGAKGSTHVSTLRGHFSVTSGVARTDDLTASIEGGALGATGSINLVDQTLNVRVIAVLTRDVSRRVGGTKVGGLMSTVLANQQGELVVPMLVTGTMQQPRFAPDVQRIAEMKLRNLVPDLRDPQRLTTGILGAITGRPEQAGPPDSPPKSTDSPKRLEDVLRELLGGGAQQEPAPPAK